MIDDKFLKLRIKKEELRILVEESFYALTISLAVLGVLELVFPRIVLSYVNLNFVLLLWLIFAIISIISFKKSS
jgi:hypothetical protein